MKFYFSSVKKEFGLIFWIHLFLIVFAYLSFLYLDWKLILIGIVFLQIYYSLRGGCDLTLVEFQGDKDTTFAWYYLRKIFPDLNKKATKMFIRYVIPAFLFLGSLVLQEVLGYIPFIKL